MAIGQLDTGRDEAEAQLLVATYGGLAHPGTHVCFMIDVPSDAPRIPDDYTSPLDLDVDLIPETTMVMSSIQVFIEHGRLSSVDLTELHSDEHEDAELSGTRWPELSRIHPWT